jgi:cytochrome P450
MPRYVRALEAVIPREIDRLLAAIDSRRPVDIVAEFSSKFAPEIMAHLIGLPTDRRETVSALSATFMRGIDPGVDFETRKASVLAGRAKRDIVRQLIADRRISPRDDLVTALVGAVPGELTEAELVALLQILYLGGYETTSHMVGNGLVQLLRHPDQFEALAADPTLARGAVEEILRLDSAISLTKMVAAEGASILGVPAEPGSIYLGLFGAANRDPKAYPDPDRFDISRKGRPHLAFGGGIHYCLGVNLARFELEKSFEAFARRFPRMRLVGEPPRLSSFMQRAYRQVMVVLEP